jgi:hypothetical protein
MMTFNDRVEGAPRRRVVLIGALLAMGGAVAGCDLDSIVELPDPDLITLPVVRDTANLPLLRNGVMFEFARAYAGEASNASTADFGQIQMSGLLADEMMYTSTFSSHQEIDARRISAANGGVLIAFRYLQRARNLAELAAELYEDSPRANSQDHALLLNLAGFTYVMFAENYCSGVPFSRQPFSGEPVYGAPQSTEQMLNLAIQRFDEAAAIAATAQSQSMVNLARVGKARALLNLGQFAQAAQVASLVPSDFVYNVEYGEDQSSQHNGVHFFNNQARRVSVATLEGTNGLNFFNRGGSPTIDPRIPVDSLGLGSGTTFPHYAQLKYNARGADIPLATGIEADLIEAEALLDRGNSNAYLPILNSLRATVGLPDLADPGTPAARVDQFFAERAHWLWLTSHRLGDLRRLVRQYGRSVNETFPIGITIFGEPYGSDVNFPVPEDELNNPNFDQCIDRNA